MAAIDKIYVRSYEDYLVIRDYFLGHEFDTRDGNHVKLRNFLYYDTSSMSEKEAKELEDWYNDGNEHPVTNTPEYVDEYLYHNCDIPIVQDYLKFAYNDPENTFNEKIENPGPSSTRVSLITKGHLAKNYPIRWYNSYLNKKMCVWDIEVNGWWYNENRDKWYLSHAREPWTSTSCHFKNRSFKSVIRKIRKWNLPVGTKIKVSGRFIGEEYVFVTK